MWLKADLHTHSKEDPVDKIKHSAKELVELAIQKGYGALAITNHTRVFYDPELDRFAEDNGLILVPGMEANVAGRHVLLYCPKDQSAIQDVNDRSAASNGNFSFDDVRNLKKQGLVKLVMAPHPYHLTRICLGRLFEENYDLFDLAEISFYSTGFETHNSIAPFNVLDRNQMTRLAVARLAALNGHRIALFASSDAHHLSSFGRAYSWVDAKPDLEDILRVLRSGDQTKITLDHHPLPVLKYVAYPFVSYIEIATNKARAAIGR